MKIVVFGANGGVGQQLLAMALAQGHRVTAALRDPERLRYGHDRLQVCTADVHDAVAVRDALRGQDVALCALGGPRVGSTLYARAASSIVSGMRMQRVRRIVFLSNFGVLGERGQGWLSVGLVAMAKVALRDTLSDHAQALQILRESGLEWSAVRPMVLTDGAWTGQYRVSMDGLPPGGKSISRADVADLMLRCALTDDYLGRVPSLSY
jgi:putative NADH-flavin reductase